MLDARNLMIPRIPNWKNERLSDWGILGRISVLEVKSGNFSWHLKADIF